MSNWSFFEWYPAIGFATAVLCFLLFTVRSLDMVHELKRRHSYRVSAVGLFVLALIAMIPSVLAVVGWPFALVHLFDLVKKRLNRKEPRDTLELIDQFDKLDAAAKRVANALRLGNSQTLVYLLCALLLAVGVASSCSVQRHSQTAFEAPL